MGMAYGSWKIDHGIDHGPWAIMGQATQGPGPNLAPIVYAATSHARAARAETNSGPAWPPGPGRPKPGRNQASYALHRRWCPKDRGPEPRTCFFDGYCVCSGLFNKCLVIE